MIRSEYLKRPARAGCRAVAAMLMAAPSLAAATEGDDCLLEAQTGDVLTLMLSDETGSGSSSASLAFAVTQKRAGDFDAAHLALHLGDPAPPAAGAWKRLSVQLDDSLCLKDSPLTTIGIVYAKPGGEAEYDRYLEQSAPALTAAGGAVALRLADPDFASSAPDAPAPYKATFVYWSDAAGPDRYLASDGFQAALPTFNDGVDVIEWFDLQAVE